MRERPEGLLWRPKQALDCSLRLETAALPEGAQLVPDLLRLDGASYLAHLFQDAVLSLNLSVASIEQELLGFLRAVRVNSTQESRCTVRARIPPGLEQILLEGLAPNCPSGVRAGPW